MPEIQSLGAQRCQAGGFASLLEFNGPVGVAVVDIANLRRFRRWRLSGAAFYTLCKMNDVAAKAWLADVLVRLSDHHPANTRRTACLASEGDPTLKAAVAQGFAERRRPGL